MMGKGVKIIKGFTQSHTIFRQFRPDVVVGFGSFFTLPVLLAALLHKVPIILHEQNAIPGKVNRLFSRFAHTTAITFPESAHYLKGETVEVMFPLREKSRRKEKSPFDYFGLNPNRRILLVFGGSNGATRLNDLFLGSVKNLSPSFQVLHFTGKQLEVEKAKDQYRALGISCCVKAFEPCMDLAMQIADLAVCRAGASTICELIKSETPAILVPFPYATENHQVKNGEHFVKKVGGGTLFLEANLKANQLAIIIKNFFEKELLIKKENIQFYKKNHHSQKLSDLILAL